MKKQKFSALSGLEHQPLGCPAIVSHYTECTSVALYTKTLSAVALMMLVIYLHTATVCTCVPNCTTMMANMHMHMHMQDHSGMNVDTYHV